MAINQVFHERTKHVEIYCYYVDEHMEKKVIKVSHTKQFVDIFTKCVGKSQFYPILFKLDIITL